ncbi:hypothetical protein [Modestobacter sp. Leaf380]|uniref:hypothetical protein n=1 Tax=Modestobacter sp. Leaf380 TaxID=1736356 RepID=UPI0006F78B1E|nr:hypothetical protein [Modestobacter sp. Leaf380]KQS66162.1 hypothetical protein ASG41_12500 [Modestobacter sp. Leaf380]
MILYRSIAATLSKASDHVRSGLRWRIFAAQRATASTLVEYAQVPRRTREHPVPLFCRLAG